MRSFETGRWRLTGVEIDGVALDCRVRGGRVAEIGPELAPSPGEQTLDGRGGALLPGLADHHAHLLATAAARTSLDLAGGSELAALPEDTSSGWLRVIGAGAEFRRDQLDRRWPDRPVRVQHRGGALWMLNSAAVERLGPQLSSEQRSSGQLWGADAKLRTMLSAIGSSGLPDLHDLSRTLASYGITHVMDATPELDEQARQALATMPQKVMSMSAAGAGPRKLAYADHDPTDPDALAGLIMLQHDAGRPVAIHAVTAVGLAVAIAAFDTVGVLVGDRIEHAAVCDDNAAARLAELGLIVVTQPSIYARHGTRFTLDSEPSERHLLWRYGGLLRAGVSVVMSSDAPYGDLDPWGAISVAAARPTEAVPVSTALTSMLTPLDDPAGPPRAVAVGAPADLCLLALARADALDHLRRGDPIYVAATFVGDLLYRAGPVASTGE